MTTPWQHTTVLLNEAVDALVTTPDGTYVDAHLRPRRPLARCCCRGCRRQGRLVAFDKDPEARAPQAARDRRPALFHPARRASRDMARAGRAGHRAWHGVLLDLGVSSPQIDNPARGFSFRFDGPLDMRMDTTRGESAAEFLATRRRAPDRGGDS